MRICVDLCLKINMNVMWWAVDEAVIGCHVAACACRSISTQGMTGCGAVKGSQSPARGEGELVVERAGSGRLSGRGGSQARAPAG